MNGKQEPKQAVKDQELLLHVEDDPFLACDTAYAKYFFFFSTSVVVVLETEKGCVRNRF